MLPRAVLTAVVSVAPAGDAGAGGAGGACGGEEVDAVITAAPTCTEPVERRRVRRAAEGGGGGMVVLSIGDGGRRVGCDERTMIEHDVAGRGGMRVRGETGGDAAEQGAGAGGDVGDGPRTGGDTGLRLPALPLFLLPCGEAAEGGTITSAVAMIREASSRKRRSCSSAGSRADRGVAAVLSKLCRSIEAAAERKPSEVEGRWGRPLAAVPGRERPATEMGMLPRSAGVLLAAGEAARHVEGGLAGEIAVWVAVSKVRASESCELRTWSRMACALSRLWASTAEHGERRQAGTCE